MRTVTRFLACRRAVLALESAIAAVFLVLALAALVEVVRTVLVNDMLQRAANRVARANALYESAASDADSLHSRIQQAVTAELGTMLDFELAKNGACSQTDDTQTEQDQTEFCLSVSIDVYDDPASMNSNTPSSGSKADLGGDAGDMVVVRLHLVPQTALGKIEQQLFGTGLRAMAVGRNERLEA